MPDFYSFVVLDIKTSGIFGEAKGDASSEITESGAVKVENGKIISRFSSLYNLGRKITCQEEFDEYSDSDVPPG